MKIEVPILVVSEANQREHWAPKRRRRMAQQTAVLAMLLKANREGGLPELPASVQFTRYGPKTLDKDNLVGAFKAVQDQLAKFYQVDDGDSRWTWLPPLQVEDNKRKNAKIIIEINSAPSSIGRGEER